MNTTKPQPPAPAHPENLSMIDKRRIEAEILGHVYQVLKASHLFNLMDARGAIAVAERQSYIGRIRDLTKMCALAWVKNEGGNSLPDAEQVAK